MSAAIGGGDQAAFNTFLEYANYLTNVIPVWRKIAALQPGLESNQIKEWRQTPGYVCMSVTGLVVLRRIGYELPEILTCDG
jgi:hypothetical protein